MTPIMMPMPLTDIQTKFQKNMLFSASFRDNMELTPAGGEDPSNKPVFITTRKSPKHLV